MAWLEEPDEFRRLVMLAVAREAGGWAEAIVQNGVAGAFSEEE